MGSKSKGVPPNPELTRVQVESMQQQMRLAEEQARQQEELQPLQLEALRFGIDSQRTAYEQSQSDRAYALDKRNQYDTALQPFLDKAQNFDEGERRAELEGETDEAITASFADAPRQQERTLGRAGFTSTALKSDAAQRQAAMAEATARAGTGHMISAQAKQEGVQAKSDALNMLSGFPAAATGLTTTGAGVGAGGVSGANAGASGIYGSMSAASKIFGQAGQSASSLWNTQAKAKYAADAAAAKQKSEMWGTAISMASMVAMSDRRLKENIRRIGTTASGLPLYTFNFKGKTDIEIGVMADEVEEVMPEAVHQIGLYKAVDYSKV